ncbi:dihydrofolate reductase family protein [Nocardioides aurantiacus]|uniref:Dihydrofolate reductase n=1 Tax=Nocardioides aurantiacus TaxID=86796 RepID=A0A3N2CR37_9ACTN|nr:dihydrofolate reductase family protein [Nocardioides aurantiacus]ROR89959.1 dihydrofolate reductase [Nocardioides aurantiacus]
MTRCRYYTATTLDGFLADEHDSLAWLFEQQHEPGGLGDFDAFVAGIGAQVMGATTYEWLQEHEPDWDPGPGQPVWVFTHRDLPVRRDGVRLVSGPLADHLDAILASAGDRDVWVIGGGDLAGQFADLGRLDEVLVSVASVVLGAGRPLLPRRLDLELLAHERNGDLLVARYAVKGTRTD